MINYIEEDLPIKYPDRTATFLRNSPYLSQFDGDTLIDLEEQEKNIEKEKLKEAEIRKIAADTQTTAQVLRATKKHTSIQAGGNTESSSSGTQTDKPPTADRSTGVMKYGQRTGTQTDRPTATSGDTQTVSMSGMGVQTDGPSTQIFDMSIDDATDAAMADADAEMQAAREEEEARKKQQITSIVARHLEENVKDLPYLPVRRERSRSKSRPVDPYANGGSGGTDIIQTVREDTGGENTKRRGRKPKKVAEETSTPMIVNQEGEQQKRSKSGETASPPARKRLNKKTEDKELKKIQAAIKRQEIEE